MKLESHVTEAIQKIQAESLERMEKAVITVRNTTVKTLSGQRTPDPSRIYKVPDTQRTYQASSPGEPPATRLGDLKDSVKWTIETQGKEITGKVGTDKEYGAVLEMGSSKILPRPWLQKSFDESKDEVIEIFNRHMEL